MSAAASRRSIRAWSRRRSRPISSDPPRVRSLPISYSAELWCEPGRALCAEYASVLVRVEKRRGDELYINDGAYGALFDAAHIGWRFPVRLVRERGFATTRPMAFSFYGPTCDDLDHMAGPFELPADVGPATISRSACSAPMAARCGPASTASARCRPVDRRRRADGEPLRRRANAERGARTSSSCRPPTSPDRSSSPKAGTQRSRFFLGPLNASSGFPRRGNDEVHFEDGTDHERRCPINDTRKAELLSTPSSISTSPASTRARSSTRWAR
jgi:hypothetical protein